MHDTPAPRSSARRWGRLRVPTLVLTFGPAVMVALVVLLTWTESAGYLPTLEQVVSWEETAGSVTFGLFAAAVVLAWWAPRVAAVLTLVALSPLGDPGPGFVVRHLWLGWLAVVVADVMLRRAQARVGRPAGHPLPDDVLSLGRRSDPWRVPRRVTAGLLVVASLTAMLLWLDRRATFIDLGERGRPAAAVVTGVDRFEDSLDVRVGSRTYDFWVDDASTYREGQDVTVMVDPLGEERPWGLGNADPDDWSMLPMLTGVLLGVAVLLSAAGPVRKARLLLQLAPGRPGWDVEVEPYGPHLLVRPLDDDRPVTLLLTPEPLDERPGGLPPWLKSWWPSELWFPDAWIGDPSTLDDVWDEIDGDDDAPQDPPARRPATVHGLERLGGATLVVLEDGTGLLSTRASRDPVTVGSLAHRVGDALGGFGRSRQSLRVDPAARHSRTTSTARDAARPSPLRHLLPLVSALVPVGAVGVFLAVLWFWRTLPPEEGVPGWFLVLLAAAFVGEGAARLLHLGARPVTTYEGVVQVHDVYTTLHVPGTLVADVRRRPWYLAIDIAGTRKTVSVHDRPAWGRLDAMADDVRQCAETSTVDGTVKRRPNAGVLAALLGASAVVGATLIGTGGMLPLA
ncbi:MULTISPECIES: hypothetical protein [unclassified Aeromicrobium]|uniref:hypothetical protein n=1 Tax=unclassified Aeromicrobium TaxID=2633570 RepID=UPI000B07AB6B|nr:MULTISPECIES: hypothetical protein [unclassified Aeromicrobium]